MSKFALLGIPDMPVGAFEPAPGGRMRLHGGKGGGSSAPAPDPALIAAQIKSMGVQDSAIQQVMSNAAAVLPLQQQQLQFGLDTSRAAYQQAQDDRSWMLNRRGALSGLQDTMVSDANSFNEDTRQQQLAAEASADVNAAFSNAAGQNARAMGRMGINPNSGRAQAVNNQNSLAQAAALASAVNKTRQAARAEGFALTDRATNALAGYPAMGMTATSSGQAFGSAGVGLANNALTGMNSGLNTAGSMAGAMGSNATGMFNAQANYKSQQDQLANSSSDLFGSVLGMGLGAYTTGMGYKLAR